MRLKSALMALKNRLLISIFLLIQFTFGLAAITLSINGMYNFYYLGNSSNSLLDLESTYFITYDGMTTDRLKADQFNKEQVEEIYNKMQQNKDVISYGTYEPIIIELESSNRPLQESMLEELKNKTFRDKSPTIRIITIDEDYYKLLNIPIKTGTGFSYQDFQKNSEEKTNVLVGPYFKKYFQIGDTINNQYTIIGFLPENKFIIDGNGASIYQKLDKAMLSPMPIDRYEHYEIMFSRLHQSTIMNLKKDADVNKLQETLQLKGSDVTLYLKNLGEEINEAVTSSMDTENIDLIVGSLFILFIIGGIVVTTIVSIMMRKREFGIKMVLGESKFGMFIQIVLENICIAIVGMFLSIVYFSWRYEAHLQVSKDFDTASVQEINLNMPILILVFLFLLLIIIVSNLIVFLFIRKLEPKTLIGGME
ncbi:ABC transporter permease [Bacillus cereus]|nr:ABC transporter permease [Bacillus cereus]PEW97092.1 ABC transporter permease [Bacillus cereus]PFK15815.1 ABC transporter permease [Bacillus cereus]PFP52150.1 ABC transporter permease [Bacillus cereus]PFV16668.1 ABC transporter permease [Bacillus cereus]